MSKEEMVMDGSPGARNEYVVEMQCTNCDWQGNKGIPYGITIEEWESLCPTCMCRTLVKRSQE